MHYHAKPVRKCHGCLLNEGDRCWLFAYPRGQWRNGRLCRAVGDDTLHKAYAQWKKQPDVKDRKTLRRETHRGRQQAVAGGEGAGWAHERGLI